MSDEINNSEEVTEQITGFVKWFDPLKGFGFVVAEQGGPDILLHINVLRNFGQNSVVEKAGIEVEAQRTSRGFQATKVLNIIPPAGEPGLELEETEILDSLNGMNTPLVPGRVKWFDMNKGFGFATAFANADDVFLHIEILRRSGLANMQPGEAIAMRIINGSRGKMAAEVLPWEAAHRQDS